MKDLSKYHHTTVRIVCESGDTISGACDWYPPEYGLSEFDVEEESLRIGDYMLFENDIREIELLRKEACFPVRAWPEAKKEIAVWFHERWHIPLEAYRESIRDCIRKKSACLNGMLLCGATGSLPDAGLSRMTFTSGKI